MTLKEVIDSAFLAKAIPDEKTMKQNIDFLSAASQKMDKQQQQKMQAVIDGMKKTDLFVKSQRELEEKQKKQQQSKKPEGEQQTTAQVSGNLETAQQQQTGSTAQ